MVLEHVADDACLFVISRPVLHAEGLGSGDLDMVQVAAVPERLEDGIGEPEHQDVLDRFLGQVMVDAEDLAFLIIGMDQLVQLAGRGEVAAEGLLDHDVAAARVLPGKPGGAEVVDNGLEHLRRDGEIEDPVAAGLVLRFERAAGYRRGPSCRSGDRRIRRWNNRCGPVKSSQTAGSKSSGKASRTASSISCPEPLGRESRCGWCRE